MYTPDGIVIVICILYYLSEVVLKLAGAVLYMECRLLDMGISTSDSGPDLHRGVRGEYPAAENDYRYRGPRGRTSRKTSVGPRLPNRADVYVRSDTVLYEM